MLDRYAAHTDTHTRMHAQTITDEGSCSVCEYFEVFLVIFY